MNITNIKYFSTVNGNGVRTAVFDDGNTIKHFGITGCFNDGEKLELRLIERK